MNKKTSTFVTADVIGQPTMLSGKRKKAYITLAIEVAYVKNEGNLLAASRKIRPLDDPQVYEWEDATSDDGNIILY